MVTVEMEKTAVTLDELPRQIPIKELYPPVVYIPGSNISQSGLFGRERVAAKILLAQLNKDGVMSESEVKESMRKALPDASDRRIETLMWMIHEDGGMIKKDVIIRKEELEEYFKCLIPHRDKGDSARSMKLLKSRGIDTPLALNLSFYRDELLKPFLDEPRATNEMIKRELSELRRWRLNEGKVMEYFRFGVFGDDMGKFGRMIDVSIKHFRGNWREHVEMLAEVYGKYGLDRTHSSGYTASREVLEANLEACREAGVDIEEMKMLRDIDLKPEEFKKELRRRFREINLKTCKAKGIDLKEVEKLLELPPKKFGKELEGTS